MGLHENLRHHKHFEGETLSRIGEILLKGGNKGMGRIDQQLALLNVEDCQTVSRIKSTQFGGAKQTLRFLRLLRQCL